MSKNKADAKKSALGIKVSSAKMENVKLVLWIWTGRLTIFIFTSDTDSRL